MTGLTPKQKALHQFMLSYEREHGVAPTQLEIARHFRFRSLGTVQNYIVRLERLGLLKKTWNARRGMKPVRQEPICDALELPLVGRVAAGRPIEAIETQDSIEVPSSLIRKGTHIALQVSGDSMIEEGIFDGDYVIIRKQPTAENGQTIVALLNNEATIKKYHRGRMGIELLPANPAYKPIPVESHVDFKIEGILVVLIRKLP